jgi:hypothetical protein
LPRPFLKLQQSKDRDQPSGHRPFLRCRERGLGLKMEAGRDTGLAAGVEAGRGMGWGAEAETGRSEGSEFLELLDCPIS